MAAPDVLNAARFSVAPMMAWTDSLCRQFHRTLSRRTLLYTEMVTAPALVRGGAVHLLDHAPSEHPVAVQLGGSDPDMLRQATELCRAAGYHEINLNVGCPSDRVQSGAFGAALMGTPQVVRNCVAAMCTVSGVEVTVKCRIGIDDQTPQETLPSFLEMVQSTSVRRVIIHARKAWLQGLSPKDNRTIPPLDYPLVEQMALDFPKLHLSINGGVETIAAAQAHLATQLQGVMVGRAAYHDPAGLLMTADSQFFGAPDPHT
ncbi:MAG: tRNA dihydrouridine(20/20a) synthase DusA, partial [Pseudomonadota bacterium]